MGTVYEMASEFSRRAAAGEHPRVSVSKTHVENFLRMLSREGFGMAKEVLQNISDPELRRMVETVFFSGCAGAVAGAAIGAVVAGPAGAQVGAIVGTVAGVAVGVVIVTLDAYQHGERLVIQA